MKSLFRSGEATQEDANQRVGLLRSYIRIIRRSSLAWVVIFAAGFLAGALWTNLIPKTLVTNPVATVRLMKSFPVGSAVMPKNTPQARDQFEPIGWWREPAVVVGYETVTYKQQEIVLCQVRTHDGEGYLLSVNASWLEPAAQR